MSDCAVLANRLSAMVQADKIPGGAVSLWVRGKTLQAGAGRRVFGQPWPCTPRTAFIIGCVIKPMTACLILELAGAGMLDLETELSAYLPGLDQTSLAKIKLRQLLDHSCGLIEELSDIPTEDVGDHDGCYGAMARKYAGYESSFSPGTEFSYSSVGYTLAAAVIERVCGCRPEALLQQWLLDPLGLLSPFGRPAPSADSEVSDGHLGKIAGPLRTLTTSQMSAYRCMNMAGSCDVKFSVSELTTFARLFLPGAWPGADAIISPGTRELMIKCSNPIQGSQLPYDSWGLGWARNGEDLIFHMGGTRISFAGLFIVPKAGVALAIATNRATYSPILFNLISDLLDEHAGVDFVKSPVTPRAEVQPRVLDLPGVYRVRDAEIELRWHGERLTGTYRYRRTRTGPVEHATEFILKGLDANGRLIVSGARKTPFDALEPLSLGDEGDGVTHLRAGRFVFRRDAAQFAGTSILNPAVDRGGSNYLAKV